MEKRKAPFWLLGGYGLLMVYLLFVRGRGDAPDVPYWTQIAANYNLRPFATVARYVQMLLQPQIYAPYLRHAIINLVGNVIMFVPLGALLPVCFPKLQKLWATALLSAGILVLVETVQLFSLTGSLDVDDLILNLFGVILGFGAYKICKKN